MLVKNTKKFNAKIIMLSTKTTIAIE